MNTTRMKRTALAVILMGMGAVSQAATLISEGFESFASLGASGWVLTNASDPTGSTNFSAGDPSLFNAQGGSAASYVAGNYNNAAAGGTVNNWLITPSFSTAVAGSISFWARADITPGFSDSLAFGLSQGGSKISDFSLGKAVTLGGVWTEYSVNFAAQGAGSVGRFAINYSGPADTSNYIGVDTVMVTSVPEPSTWLMMGIGLAGLAGAARRRRAN
jgi:PEP-CTERM motif